MCGLTGFWEAERFRSAEELRTLVRAMSLPLRHRGPDDEGDWVDADAGIAVGFRRLSIIDLSPEGHQPMLSASGQYVIVFNGEIYNFLELRQELEQKGHRFRGRSDTEVMLASFEQWGVDGALRRFNGMFAFALWDRKSREMWLARDRVGKKPLYYGSSGSTFMFGSELKALEVHPAFDSTIDLGSLAAYLRHGYIPGPWSIYEKYRKLMPGCWLRVSTKGVLQHGCYWSAQEAVRVGVSTPYEGSFHEATENLRALLESAVSLRMIADVPLGAFLSGGIDSSLVVSIMQAVSSRPVRTFAIGFHEQEFNEARHARLVADHLRTDHTELYVTGRQAMDVIPLLPGHYSEPFADASQIPTFLVSQLARQHVTVSLSGDGGDELFGGYTSYVSNERMWSRFRRLPTPLRRAAASSLTLGPDTWRDRFFTSSLLPESLRRDRASTRLRRLALALRQQELPKVYRQMMSLWEAPNDLLPGVQEHRTAFTDSGSWVELETFAQTMMYLDLVLYLPDDILTKVDRASMAVSLEARCPLLDHRIVEFAWTLPLAYKLQGQEGKRILRHLLYQYVPRQLVDRPKTGFGIPLDAWLRGPLRDWAATLLDKPLREAPFEKRPILEKWQSHVQGECNWGIDLWLVLMFLSWKESLKADSVAACAS
jgi:asparagine synthase (glutamine-hydrolysing)